MNRLIYLAALWLCMYLDFTAGAAAAGAAAHEVESASGDADTATINNVPIETTLNQHKEEMTDVSIMDHSNLRRRLPAGFDFDFNSIGEALNGLATTPPNGWRAEQWGLFAFLVLVALYCCGCCACNRRRQRQGYGQGYPGQYGPGGYGQGGYGGGYGGGGGKSGGGIMSCLRNVLMCFCCYELCCADCAHVPCFNHSRYGFGESAKVGEANNMEAGTIEAGTMYRGDLV